MFFSLCRVVASRPFAGWLLLLVCVVTVIGAQGCTTRFDEHRGALDRLAGTGAYAAAASSMDEAKARGMYGDRNGLLFNLDRGAVALFLGDHETAFVLLEQAEDEIELYFRMTAADQASRWLINDTAARYYGRAYEDQYVNVLKLLSHLERGEISGVATVEARRLGFKADQLRDRYLREFAAISERGGGRFESDVGRGGYVDVTSGGQFIESPLGTFLSAVTFMASDDRNEQGVAARRLRQSIEAQGALIGPVSASAFEGLEDDRLGDGKLLFVAFSGRTPALERQRFGPIPVFDWPVYFELPVMRVRPGEVSRVLVVESSGRVIGELPLVEDMARVAAANHERELPKIYARTLLRSQIKAGASFAATQVARASNNDALVIVAVLGGLAAVALTEKADTRSWLFLPGRAHAGLLDLPPGEHRVRAEFVGSSGGVVYTSEWSDVVVSPGRLTTVSAVYWR